MPRRSRAAALVLAVTFALLTGSLLGVAGAQTSSTTEPSPSTTEPTTAPAPPPSTTAVPPTTAPESPKVGDSRIDASVAVRFCPRGKGCAGMHIYIDSAAHHFKAEKYSLCTKNENSQDFVQVTDPQRRTVAMTTNTDFGCLTQPSYNVWVIEAYENGVRVSRGFVWVGQDIAGLKNYYAKCFSSPATQSLTNNFTCSQGRQPLSLTVGRADAAPFPTEPSCPAAGSQCAIDVHFDTSACPNFTAPATTCTGTSTGTPSFANPIFSLPGSFTSFLWAGTTTRRVIYGTAVLGAPTSNITGGVEGSNPTSDFRVSDAVAFASPYPNVHWYTKDAPGAGAGAPGGPLLLEFKNGITGADMYLSGYLERKPR